ncbi:MAG: TIGR00725 family protein [Candidatus Odinarchaeota archaeon]
MKKKGLLQIGVIGDSEATKRNLEIAEGIGSEIAKVGGVTVTGGRGGVMEAACRGAKSLGGITVAILPGEDEMIANDYCDIVLPTGLGWARNSLVALSSDAVIVIGGRSGTLSEIAYSWMHKRVICAIKGTGGWADRLAGQHVDDRNERPVLIARDAVEAVSTVLKILD